MLNLFLQAVESSFDHTVEVFLIKPEKFSLIVQNDLQNVFILRKKNVFPPKSFHWTRGNFFDKIGKFLAQCRKTRAKHFFFKNSFFGEKIHLDTYNAVLAPPSKNFDKGPKNLRSMFENDQKQYKIFYFRKSLRLNCSYGHVKFCLDKPVEIFSTEPEIFSVHVENVRQKYILQKNIFSVKITLETFNGVLTTPSKISCNNLKVFLLNSQNWWAKVFFKTLLLKIFPWTFKKQFWQRCQYKFTEGWNFCA